MIGHRSWQNSFGEMCFLNSAANLAFLWLNLNRVLKVVLETLLAEVTSKKRLQHFDSEASLIAKPISSDFVANSNIFIKVSNSNFVLLAST